MTGNNSSDVYPISVVGGGLIGLVAALSLARLSAMQGKSIALIAPTPNGTDGRTTAMLMPSINMLNELGVWEATKQKAAPLKTMRLIDGSKRLVRSPVTDFRSAEIDLEAFGYNIPNAQLLKLLEEQIELEPNIVRVNSMLMNVEHHGDRIDLHCKDGSIISTQLAAAADGRNSLLRQSANITTRSWSYPQTALALNFSHTLSHNAISTEFHTETGPFTQVPLPPTVESQDRSSLVWLTTPREAELLKQRTLGTLGAMIEEKLQSSLGECTVEGKPQSFEMAGMTANQFAASRTVLLGEAGHVFPPIGAQGFNLGMRDISDLAESLQVEAQDFGSGQVMKAFNRKRLADVHLRTAGVDMLNRSLLTSFLPVQIVRAAGLSVLGSFPALRKFIMRQGVGANAALLAPTSLLEIGQRVAGRWQSDRANRSR